MTPALRARLEQVIVKWQSREALLCRKAGAYSDTYYAQQLGAEAEGIAVCVTDLRAVLASLDAPQEPQAAKDTQLIADILADYRDDLTKKACDECEQCGEMFMCSFHSVLSALARDTWTNAAIERSRRPPAVAQEPPEDAVTRIGARALWQLAHDLGWDRVECGTAYGYLRYRLSLPPSVPLHDAAPREEQP